MDQLTDMRVSCAVVDLESFSRAAGQLGMARSMATKHVGALGDRLGVGLLHRATRELSRTEAGPACPRPGTGEEWRAEGPQGARATVRVPWAMRANNGDVLRAAALDGAGIVVQPTFLVGQHLADGRLVEPLPSRRPSSP